ncbi:MAG: RluA family pseudouridine synthase [Myxococcota bacterium]|nr:RluA family pseudouridine synthase [Myxococcota bacterium]
MSGARAAHLLDGRIKITVPHGETGKRVDRFLASALGVSRSELQRWMLHGRVTVEGVACRAALRLREGEHVEVHPLGPEATFAVADPAVRFDVIYVDDDVVVVDKPPGLVVHPARGHADGTLVNGLLALGLFGRDDLADPMDPQGYVRPGIVHRLDKGTSGVLVVARTSAAREALKAQFQAHTMERVYEAIIVGQLSARTFDTLHGRHPADRLRFTSRVSSGKRAVTHVRVLADLGAATHVECRLETGRTHQIRMHLAEGGAPVLGDPLYGRTPRDPRVRAVSERLGHQALHARVLGFVHPRTGSTMRFDIPPPVDFSRALEALRVDEAVPGWS